MIVAQRKGASNMIQYVTGGSADDFKLKHMLQLENCSIEPQEQANSFAIIENKGKHVYSYFTGT